MGGAVLVGRAATVSVGTEIAIATTLGLAAGAVWKMYHWNARAHQVEMTKMISK